MRRHKERAAEARDVLLELIVGWQKLPRAKLADRVAALRALGLKRCFPARAWLAYDAMTIKLKRSSRHA